MKPPKQPTPRNVPRIDWPNLTDEALEELRRLVEAERERRLSRPVLDALYETGLLRMCTPRSLGGLEVDPITRALVTEEIGKPYFAFDEKWLKSLTPTPASKLSIVRVDGDSMSPTLNDGDEILVDLGDCVERLRVPVATGAGATGRVPSASASIVDHAKPETRRSAATSAPSSGSSL